MSHTYLHTRYHTPPPRPLKSFSQKVTMGITPSVTEVQKDRSCAARLFSLFLMKRKGCTVGDDQALSLTFVNLQVVIAFCFVFLMGLKSYNLKDFNSLRPMFIVHLMKGFNR